MMGDFRECVCIEKLYFRNMSTRWWKGGIVWDVLGEEEIDI